MAHFNFVISQNAKWGHAGFYIDCHRMTVPENILLQKSTDQTTHINICNCTSWPTSAIPEGPRNPLSVEILSTAANLYGNAVKRLAVFVSE